MAIQKCCCGWSCVMCHVVSCVMLWLVMCISWHSAILRLEDRHLHSSPWTPVACPFACGAGGSWGAAATGGGGGGAVRAADERIFPARSGLIAYSQSWRSLSLPACTRNPWLRVTILKEFGTLTGCDAGLYSMLAVAMLMTHRSQGSLSSR